MSGIGVKKSSSVGSELFNDFLGSHRTLRQNLLRSSFHFCCTVFPGRFDLLRLHQSHFCIRIKVLNHSLRYQKNGPYHAKGKKDVQSATDKIYPEIAESLRFFTCNSTDESYC